MFVYIITYILAAKTTMAVNEIPLWNTQGFGLSQGIPTAKKNPSFDRDPST
jgi:hypothetical protein